MDFLLPALVCAAVSGVAGWFVPRLIALVPEPVAEVEEEDAALLDVDEEPRLPAPVKVLYAEIAARRGLGWRTAVLAAVAGGLCGGVLGWVWPLVYVVPFVPFGVALGVIDARTKLLPTWLLAPAYPVLIVLVLLCGTVTRDWDDLRRAGFGWLILGGFYLLTWLISPRLAGYGDVRLAGLLGMGLGYLGWGPLLIGWYSAYFLYAIPGLLVAAASRDRSVLRKGLPFGPAMLVGALLGVTAGAAILDWYLRRQGITS